MDSSSTPPDTEAVLVALSAEMADELAEAGLAAIVPKVRGAVLEAVLLVGSNAATMVTLLQGPQTLRAFAAWMLHRASTRGEGIEVKANTKSRRVRLEVRGDIPLEAVVNFLSEALTAPADVTDPSSSTD